ncbi:MAG: glycosyltransferase [Planctomycetales bacterium]|nr:glycosyltransferase [Planctomycetales bacterium]
MNSLRESSTPLPKISVVMPVRNGSAFLPQAINSILKQTYTDFEFIVVDDASSDETPAILKSVADPRLFVLTNDKNIGVSASLNRGIEHSNAPLIARMDADDVCMPERLSRQVGFMDANPKVVLCGTEAVRIDQHGNRLNYIKRLGSNVEIRWHLLTANPFIHPSVVFRTNAFRRVGGYSPELPCAQDYDLWCRLSLQGECANLLDALVQYRFHDHAISAQKRDRQLQVTRERSHQYLFETGLAKSEVDAAVVSAFSALSKHDALNRDVIHNALSRYHVITEDFFRQFNSSDTHVAESIRRCRRKISQNVTRRVNAGSYRILRNAKLILLARRIDPSAITTKRLLKKIWNCGRATGKTHP